MHLRAIFRRLFGPLPRWMLAAGGLHFLAGLGAMCLARTELRYAALPSEPGWVDGLQEFFLLHPALLCGQWPIALPALAKWLLLQSLLFGLICVPPLYAVVTGTLLSAYRRLIRLLLMPAVALVMLVFFSLVMMVVTMLASGINYYDIRSDALPPGTDRQGWLARHLAPPAPGPVLASEFRLHALFGGIGPSTDLSVIAVKVPPADVDAWIASQAPGCRREPAADISIQEPVALRGSTWRRASRPEQYQNGDGVVTVYRREGILIIDNSLESD